MCPIIHVGSFQIRSHFVMNAVAFVLLLLGMRWRVRRSVGPFPTDDLIASLVYVLLGACAGAWLAFTLPSAVAYTRGTPVRPDWWRGHYWLGALGGGSLVGYIRCRRRGYRVGKAFDLIAPILPLAQVVGRLGCLLGGGCYGRETTAWPSLVLPDVNGVWARRYPTRIVSMIATLVIAITILAYERYRAGRRGGSANWPFDGFLFVLYVQLYCAQRFLFEFWRADMPILFGSVTWTHPYCVVGFVLATVLMVREFRRAPRSPEPVEG